MPILQCAQCADYSIKDDIMARVDQALEKTDRAAELEIVRFVA